GRGDRLRDRGGYVARAGDVHRRVQGHGAMTAAGYAQERVTAAARVQAKRRRDRRRLATRMLKRLLIIAICVIMLAPTYLVVIASLGKGGSFFSASLIPKNVSWANYHALFSGSDFLTWTKNSVIVCFAVATFATVCS